MKNIDILLLFFLITAVLGLIVMPKRVKGVLRPWVILLTILAIVQFLLESYFWQYLPSYLLIFFLVILIFTLKNIKTKRQKIILQIALLFFLIISIVPWIVFLPIPNLIKPQGQYKVGTRIFRWIDFNRAEQITSDSTDKRNVVVQAWYPTEQDAKGERSAYLDGMDSLPEKIGILPRWVLNHYDQINTYGILNAPISKIQNKWPVIIFLTGNVASRAFYTSLVADLASHGYVVLAIDHPYEAMITELANGKIVTTIEDHKNATDLTDFMKARIDTRIADVQFVLTQLGNSKDNIGNFFSSLDQNRIFITGHSLGGATAAVAMALDSRIKAAANIDGTLYGDLPERDGPRPFLLLESNKAEKGRYERYEKGNQKLFKQFGGGYRYEIIEADHYSFTDAPLLLANPARFLTGRLLKFGNIPSKTHNATVDILNAFFSGTLATKLSDSDSISASHPGVIRKPID